MDYSKIPSFCFLKSPMNTPEQQIIDHTRNWIQDFIIQLNICPFAQREVKRNSLRLQVAASQNIEQALEWLIDEIRLLDNNPTIETSLLLFPNQFQDFFAYLDFVELAETLLQQSGYEGVYQLATFHPLYCFAEVEFDDVSNYTNRSPYPMLHLLREASVEKAIRFYGDTSKIPQQNIDKMHQLGLKAIMAIVESCRISSKK